MIAEVGLCDPDAAPDEVARFAEPGEFAADEIRAALAWTRHAATREHDFAHTLRTRLPAVLAALDAGEICRSKAWTFTSFCEELTDAQAHVVCQRLLPVAGRLATGELAARLKKLAIALDPEWAARRYAAALRDRDVIAYLDPDGTATLTGRCLPPDQVPAACARIDDLARAAKRAGRRGRMGALRAEICLGLLDGRWAGHTRAQILADVLADEPSADNSTDPASPDTAPTDPAATRLGPASAEPNSDPAAPNPERVGVQLRVGLPTLLGLDRHPGEIVGLGPVTTEVARILATRQRQAEWRFAVTDRDGQLLLAGLTRYRPDGQTRNAGSQRDGIVELHVPRTVLRDLAAHSESYGLWAGLLTDLAAQYDKAHARPVSRQHPTARFAGAALRRHVELRDRYCVFPGCRYSARFADLDHTRDHSRGGTTTGANTGPVCRHDHRLKHEGRWRLHQPEPGHFVWTSPLGRAYHTRPQPFSIDLPVPVPRRVYPGARPDPPDEDGPIFRRPPPRPEPPPPPPPRVVDPDEPPPF